MPKKPISIFILMFLISSTLMFKNDFMVSADLAIDYLSEGYKIAFGNESLMPFGDFWTRRYLFVLLIAGALKISGGVLWSSQIVIALIASAFVTSFCYFVFKAGGRLLSFLTFILLISSPTIIYWAPRHIDAFWPIFLFISLAIIHTDEKHNGLAVGLLSGATAALALFIKETSMLFIAAPTVLFLFNTYQTNYKRLVGFYAIYVPMLLLFWYYLSCGPQYLQASALVGGKGLSGIIQIFVAGIVLQYNLFVGKFIRFYFLSKVMMVAIVYCAFMAIYFIRDKQSYRLEKIVFACFLCFFPLDVIVGAKMMRISQNLFSACLLFLSCLLFLKFIVLKLVNKMRLSLSETTLQAIATSVMVIAVLSTSALSYSYGKDADEVYENTLLHLLLHTGKLPTFQLRGQQLGKYILCTEQPEGGVLVQKAAIEAGARLATKGALDLHMFPQYGLTLNNGHYRFGTIPLKGPLKGDMLIKVSGWPDRLEIVSQKYLYEYIHSRNISHVVLPGQSLPILEEWLLAIASRSFSIVDTQTPYTVYVIKHGFTPSVDESRQNVYITNAATKYIRKIARHHYAYFRPFRASNLWDIYSAALLKHIPTVNEQSLAKLASLVPIDELPSPFVPLFASSVSQTLGFSVKPKRVKVFAHDTHHTPHIVVSNIPPDSKTYGSGLNVGDVILSINGISIANVQQFHELVRRIQAAGNRFHIQALGDDGISIVNF